MKVVKSFMDTMADNNMSKQLAGSYNPLNKTIINNITDKLIEWDILWTDRLIKSILKSHGYKPLKSITALDFTTLGKKTLEPKLGDIVILAWGDKDSEIEGLGLFLCKKGRKVSMITGSSEERTVVHTYDIDVINEYRTPTTKKIAKKKAAKMSVSTKLKNND